MELSGALSRLSAVGNQGRPQGSMYRKGVPLRGPIRIPIRVPSLGFKDPCTQTVYT